mmetsp:Transcript_62675/g.141443  ORF Transcript_62675/g.141443 Transcript_62675/m.141443 type:complete len:236 (+) Transcript_62675:88-795(+)
MVTTLGWRDAGQVLLSKADAARRKGEEQRGDDIRETPVFQGAVMSQRQHRTPRVDKGAELVREEAAALPVDPQVVLAKKPESRVKWLLKALVLAGKKGIKVEVVYDIVTNKKFTQDVRASQGAQLKSMLYANLHLFSSKQQKILQSEGSGFAEFSLAPPGGRDADSGKRRSSADASSSKRRRRGSSEESSSGSRGDRSPARKSRSSRDGGRAPPPRPAAKVDPRIFARGAADDDL